MSRETPEGKNDHILVTFGDFPEELQFLKIHQQLKSLPFVSLKHSLKQPPPKMTKDDDDGENESCGSEGSPGHCSTGICLNDPPAHKETDEAEVEEEKPAIVTIITFWTHFLKVCKGTILSLTRE